MLGAMRESKLARLPQGPIEYIDRGQGSGVVVVFHGGNTSCAQIDFGFSHLVDEGFRVIVPSRPGYGRTPLSTGPSQAETAGAVLALLDSLQVDHVWVIADSAGGPAALSFAASFPDRTRGLLLEAAVTKGWIEESHPLYRLMRWTMNRYTQWFVLGLQRIWTRLRPRRALRGMLKHFTLLPTEDVYAQLGEGDVAWYRDFAIQMRAGSGFMRDMAGAGPIGSISCPTLIMQSRHDASVSFAHAEHAAAHIPQAELWEAPCLTHWLAVGPGAEEVRRRRMAFLSR